MELELKNRIDNLCDYTYNFTWQGNRLLPGDIIPSQNGTDHTYKDLVDELRKGRDVRIYGDAGKRLGYSMGVDLKHFNGSGRSENAGNIFIEGNVSSEMGMGMVSGTIYIKGGIEEPLGNVIEVISDKNGYRKFMSITEIICSAEKHEFTGNSYDRKRKHLEINDGIPRGTVAARCECDARVTINGDAYNGTGLLMKKGAVHVKGNAGMNTGAHLNGGTVIVDGTSGEFAGAYMKNGTLILNDATGFAGANMKEGVIYAKNRIRTSNPVTELTMSKEDGKNIMEHTGVRDVEAMSYHKYGLMKEKLVRMRDGSFVLKKVE